jgi:hypothetical protein
MEEYPRIWCNKITSKYNLLESIANFLRVRNIHCAWKFYAKHKMQIISSFCQC